MEIDHSPPSPCSPRRPGGDAGPGSERQPPPVAIQGPLYRRHPLGRPRPAGPQLDRAASEEGLHLRPAQDHPRGEPPPLPDSGASAQRKGQGYGGPCCPGHEAGLEGGDHPRIVLVLDRHLDVMAELADRVFCFIFGLAFVLGYLNGYLGFWH